MRIAALDLGSNSFHLVVVETRPDGSFVPLVRDKVTLRLGDVVARTGAIEGEAADAAVEVVRNFAAQADAEHADELIVFGTASLREASNGAALVDRIEAETGVRVEVVSGVQEARVIFDAVRASVLLDRPPALCADLGGGSLELMVGDRSRLQFATSLHLGVGRLTAELVRSDPPSRKDRARLRRRVDGELAGVLPAILRLQPQMLVGSSGTLVSLARMAAAARDGAVPESVNQLSVTAADLATVRARVFELTTAEREAIPGLDQRRAELVPAGLTVLEALMESTALFELTVSEWALREGMVLSAIGAHDRADLGDDPRAIRLASVLSLCRRSNWRERHGRQVARLAAALFDATAPLHGLEASDRELIELGGLLHDIGEHVSADGHARHSAYLIENGGLRGFASDEVRILACLGRYHVRGTPRAGFPPYRALSAAARSRVVRLLALLCLADALDASHASIAGELTTVLGPEEVEVVIGAGGDAELEIWMVNRKRELFERTFRRRLVVRPRNPAELRLARVSAEPA